MSVKVSEFVTHVVDMLEPLGPVSARRMFGGYGIFLDGMMFALVADDTLYLKVDDESRSEFAAAGLEDKIAQSVAQILADLSYVVDVALGVVNVEGSAQLDERCRKVPRHSQGEPELLPRFRQQSDCAVVFH